MGNTSRYPTSEVVALVRLALTDLDTTGVHVNVKNSRIGPRGGTAYSYVPSISNAPKGSDYLITVGLGPESMFPMLGDHYVGKRPISKGGQWPEFDLRDWRDALVLVAAHEGKHIEQYRENLRRSEIACEHHAAWVLSRYQQATTTKEATTA